MGEPARGYKWPQAWPGNDLALKHGAHSDSRIEPVAADITAHAIEAVPWLQAPEYAAALAAWSRAEARCALLADYLDEHGLLDEKGDVRPAADLVVKLERQASEARSKLGLDPISRAALERNLTTSARGRVDMAKELAEGRRLRLAAEERAREGADDDS